MPAPEPREILPGVVHWTTMHEGIDAPVSSYAVVPAGVVIDPRVPDGGFGALAAWPAPRQVVLTSAHHARHAELFSEEYGGIPVRASRQAAERLGAAVDVDVFGDGDEVAPGIRAVVIGVLSPDETALHVGVGEGALAFADGVHRYRGELAFFRDELLGDDPEAVKAGLRAAFRGLLERDFDHLLFAHGDPVVGGGKAVLRDFAGAG
jgi:hypothetical protein